MSLALDIAGWIGAALLILAYGLASWGRVAATSSTYQLLNLIGSAMILLNSAYNRAFPSAATNLFWILVGVFALARRNEFRRSLKPGHQ